FHAASIWALTTASRLVDMTFYASVKENNALVHALKKEFRNGIVVQRNDIDWYAQEAEAILIGPGMMRTEKLFDRERDLSLQEITALEDEGEQTYFMTKYLLKKFPDKKWIIDAGALQMMELTWLKQLKGQVLLTPHQGEFDRVFDETREVSDLAQEYNCTILLKGEKDIVCSPEKCIQITGGNAGMTKGGTGDVLAGLIAGLASKNDLFVAAAAGSYINKKAGESLYERVGNVFNASDLANEIPVVMKKLLFS
ncbi:MAG: NAD(P)H-hydrate dehydratase, partial [Candidatus Levybacteria bacterium]|nr:NAD(P)H-hydrate dehydratase [Candidatus Levybacteria bacterium]